MHPQIEECKNVPPTFPNDFTASLLIATPSKTLYT